MEEITELSTSYEFSKSSEFSMCAYVTDGKLGTKNSEILIKKIEKISELSESYEISIFAFVTDGKLGTKNSEI